MTPDETLEQKVREALTGRADVSEKKMFGGTCFLLNGNMLCGTTRGRLMFRVGKEQYAAALQRPGAGPMDITGKTMPGFVFVVPEDWDQRGIRSWLALAENYVGRLPRKVKKAARG